jgi:protein SCO1/2
MVMRMQGLHAWFKPILTRAISAALCLALCLAHGQNLKDDARLAKIGPAPDIALIDQDGQPFSLAALHGKVAVVTFIYASCVDTCPLLTAKMVGMRKKLGKEFGARIHFVSVTVDPDRDTPEVLRKYAEDQSANQPGWSFVTGSAAQIQDVTRRYGLFVGKQKRGDIDHTFLTSIIDQRGTLRVQYLGVRFDPDEFVRDVRSVLRERAQR